MTLPIKTHAGHQAPPHPLEIELKLALPFEQQAAFLKLMARRRSPAQHHELVTLYFDTPDGALAGRGIALRLRRSGRRWVQTLKTEGARQGGLSQRVEYEMPVPAARLDWSRFPDAARAWVADSQRRKLVPVFETRFARTAWQLRGTGGARIEVALDVGEIRAGKHRQPICEIELELKAGPSGALFAQAQDWALKLDCLPFDTSKAERGLKLARQQPDLPVRFVPPALKGDMRVERAFVSIVSACLTHFQANLPGVLAGHDRECLHQARVALRRLRVALRLFRRHHALPDALWKDLRAIDAALGPARDWDVLCDEMLPAIAPHFDNDALWQAGRVALEAKRAALHSSLRETLRRLRPGAWLLAVNHWLYDLDRGLQPGAAPASERASPRPLGPWARRKLKRLHLKLTGRAPEWGAGSPARQHALRLEIKRQRYAVEFFQALFAHPGQPRYVSAVRSLQASLGQINDIRTARRLVTETPELAGATRQFVLGWLAARESGSAPRAIARQLKNFINTPPCW